MASSSIRGFVAKFLGDAARTLNRNNGSGYRQPTVDNSTPQERTLLAGLGVNHWRSNHRDELLNFTGWAGLGARVKGLQCAEATFKVARLGNETITKSHETHDPEHPKSTPLPHHPLTRLLERPNRRDTKATFLYRCSIQQDMAGAAFVWRVNNKLGRPYEYYCLPRSWWWPVMPNRDYPMGGWRITPEGGYYATFISSTFGTNFYVADHDTLKFGWPDPNSPGEYTSPVSMMKLLVDISNSRDSSLLWLLENVVDPSMILSMPLGTTDVQMKQLKAAIEANNSGPRNRKKTLLAAGIEKIDINGDIKGFDEASGREQDRKNILGSLHVPESAAGFATETSYSAASVSSKTFIRQAIQPFLGLIAEEIQNDARICYRDPLLTVTLKAEAVEDETMDQSWAEKKGKGYTDNVVTVNQYLAAMKLPPQQGGDVVKADWDKLHQPLPEPGAAGAMPGQPGQDQQGADEFDLSPEFDLEQGPPTATTTGQKRPEMQQAAGNRNGMPSMNGKH